MPYFINNGLNVKNVAQLCTKVGYFLKPYINRNSHVRTIICFEEIRILLKRSVGQYDIDRQNTI